MTFRTVLGIYSLILASCVISIGLGVGPNVVFYACVAIIITLNLVGYFLKIELPPSDPVKRQAILSKIAARVKMERETRLQTDILHTIN
jgi:predicted membrane channel-forming protein YqfA (hemolysin III family)